MRKSSSPKWNRASALGIGRVVARITAARPARQLPGHGRELAGVEIRVQLLFHGRDGDAQRVGESLLRHLAFTEQLGEFSEARLQDRVAAGHEVMR